MNIHWISKEKLFLTAIKSIESASSVLDIGCGIYPQGYIAPKIHICCEPYNEYLQYLQMKYGYDKRFILLKATWQQVVKLFSPKSIDTVFLLDVIEHIPKNEGKNLLKLTEKIAKKQVIIFTPLGFVTQFHENNIDAWGMKGGEWQRHKSGWLPKDFDTSWEIYACKNFHKSFYNGKIQNKTYGAFWAIKTFPNKTPVSVKNMLLAYLFSKLSRQHPAVIFFRRVKHILYLKLKEDH